MTSNPGALDPRAVPRELWLDRLGARRPALSIVALIEGSAGDHLPALRADADARGIQLIVVQTRSAAPALGPEPTVIRREAETVADVVNRAAVLATGRLLLVLLGPCDRVDEASLDGFMADPWLGAVRIGDGEHASIMTRESLWTGLGGLEPLYRDLDWAIRDFCLRARAIGYRAPDGAFSGDGGGDAELFAQRADRAPAKQVSGPAVDSSPRHGLQVYTAITNCYDSLKLQPPTALAGCKATAFLDRDTAAAHATRRRGWHIASIDTIAAQPGVKDPHRASRFPKINAHLALPEAEYSLWIDASIGIVCPFPLMRLVDMFLGDHDLCVFRHYARRSIEEEAEACKARGLDDADTIDSQIARYRAEGFPSGAGLIEAPVLLRRHTPAVRALNESWWAEIEKGSRRDQLSFNYVAWKLGLRYSVFPLILATGNGLFVKYRR